jgi:hypothetical protein
LSSEKLKNIDMRGERKSKAFTDINLL